MDSAEDVPLYGRDPLLRALVPRLTGLKYDERARTAREFQHDLPVVLVTGRHGMGRSAVLRELAAHYRDRLPLAHVRIAPAGYTSFSPAASDADGDVATDLVGVLMELARQLAPSYRRPFPVLLPGLFAVSSWDPGDDADRDAACLRLARLLIACHLADGPEQELRQAWAGAVEARVEPVVPRAPGGPGSGAASISRALHREYAHRYRAGAERDWYRGRFPQLTEDADPVELLGDWYHQGGDYRRSVERTLVAAFRHDVAGSYGRLQRWNREPWPLVLLDDVHLPAGRRFLDLLLEHRAMPESPEREELVVVATRLGEPPGNDPGPVRRQLADLVRTSGWERRGTTPSAGLLTVPLTPLSRDDVLPLLEAGSAGAPLHPYLASALHTLTGGHPAATTMLCSAVRAATRAGLAVAPRDLLELSAKDGRPVGEALLERLLPDRRQRDRLTLLSLARDSTAAEELATRLRLEGPEQLPANAVTDYLEQQHWQRLTPPESPLVTDPLLQKLLVHEARRLSPGPDDSRGWQEIHRFLHDHHARRADEGEADALRHMLAAGGVETVVASLAESFQSERDERGAGHWLRCLRHAATAPTPPARDWEDDRLRIALGAHDGRRYAHLDDTERCVNRLLHALWYLSEPHTEPDPDTCTAIEQELAYLSLRHPSWRVTLGQAARRWPAAARDKRPLPIPGQ
ncbi:ATP-binding protein [Streptomyces alboniger]|uniref:ATP-binding protein n=1 Tax=Streptomyces alboniger TaxID=132473 RepID=A0A5J6HIG2_STRAD|nr:ATP-binding protein [Streptomyces alboniger]QEV16815.1 ATP-binding protein [Streptomyces alboniger]